MSKFSNRMTTLDLVYPDVSQLSSLGISHPKKMHNGIGCVAIQIGWVGCKYIYSLTLLLHIASYS